MSYKSAIAGFIFGIELGIAKIPLTDCRYWMLLVTFAIYGLISYMEGRND